MYTGAIPTSEEHYDRIQMCSSFLEVAEDTHLNFRMAIIGRHTHNDKMAVSIIGGSGVATILYHNVGSLDFGNLVIQSTWTTK